jgi:hypothetical protein
LVTYYQSIIRSYFTFGAVFYVCGAVLAMFSTNETGVMNIILIILAIAGIFVGHILLAIMVKGLYSTLFLQRYILDIALGNNGIKLFNKEKIRKEIKSQIQN